LVLAAVPLDPGVVTGCEMGGSERQGMLQKILPPDLAVALEARIRGETGGISLGEEVYDLAPEETLDIECIERKVECGGDPAGGGHVGG
jgi:hypothetical protein